MSPGHQLLWPVQLLSIWLRHCPLGPPLLVASRKVRGRGLCCGGSRGPDRGAWPPTCAHGSPGASPSLSSRDSTRGPEVGMGSRAPWGGYWNVPEMPLRMPTGWSLSLGGTSHLRCPHPGTWTVEASIVLGPYGHSCDPSRAWYRGRYVHVVGRGAHRMFSVCLSRELLSGPTAAGLLQALSEPLTADVGEGRP